MELSQENRYVIQCFREKFIDENRGNIIIYGIGANTRAILEMIKNPRIVGLMDATCEGEIVMGLPVYSVEEASEHGDCVVIVARNSVVPIIYERIHVLEEKNNLPIYNIYGERLKNREKKTYFENENVYWTKNEADLFVSIDRHEIISFDIFDTLIVRKCMLPTDVFEMVEMKLAENGFMAEGFATARREAEILLEGTFPKLQDIYDVLQRTMDCSYECREMAYKMELWIEKKVCVPRKTMCAVYKKAIELGKRVILTSDMYLPEREMKILLTQCGIIGYERLFISCEEKAEKKNGGMYKKLKASGYERVLHVGDNEKTDGEMALKYNIDAFTILSPYEMMVQSSMHNILAYADSLEKRKMIGAIQTRLFDDPFCLANGKGKVEIIYGFDIGYVFLAPIVSCFLFFLADELKRQRMDKVLFCARDGYVIWKLYQKLVENSTEDLPRGVYFKTSRRAITVASIERDEDILLILKKPYNTTMGELLYNRFGVRHALGDIDAGNKAVSTKNASEVEKYILGYREKIISNAKCEKEAYLNYMHQEHITDGNKIGIYDFCSGGTIQYYFKKITSKDVRGIYFATVNIPNTLFNDTTEMNTLFGNIGQYETRYHLAEHYMYMEAVLTDEHGTLIKYTPEGNPIYDEQENERRSYTVIEEIQRGINCYFDEVLGQKWQIDYENIKDFSDMLLGCLFQPEHCHVSENLKNVIKAESAYDFLEAYSAWNRE